MERREAEGDGEGERGERERSRKGMRGEREIVKSYRKNNPKNSHVFIKDFFML